MRSVSIIGAGVSKFGEQWDTSLRELITDAGMKAIVDAGVEGKDIQAVFGGCMASGSFSGQEHIGALIADQLGLNPVSSTRCEAACASGGVALRAGYFAVASGLCDVVAVGGVEKMTDVDVEEAAVALAGAGDEEWELFNGATFPAIYALMARRHMFEYGTTEEQMASVAVKNHANGVHNPFAQYQKAITIQEVMESGYIASPLKLLDCSPITDGAAAVIICATDKAKKFNKEPIEILSLAQASDALALANRESLTKLTATEVAARDAFKQAKLTPKDVDFAEVHDCFTIAEIMAIEDLGFFKKGHGGKATLDGETALNSKLSINTSGGLKAKGHPVGATGVAQVSEIVFQMRETAGSRQLKNHEIGLTHNVGGSGATAVVGLYKRL